MQNSLTDMLVSDLGFDEIRKALLSKGEVLDAKDTSRLEALERYLKIYQEDPVAKEAASASRIKALEKERAALLRKAEKAASPVTVYAVGEIWPEKLSVILPLYKEAFRSTKRVATALYRHFAGALTNYGDTQNSAYALNGSLDSKDHFLQIDVKDFDSGRLVEAITTLENVSEELAKAGVHPKIIVYSGLGAKAVKPVSVSKGAVRREVKEEVLRKKAPAKQETKPEYQPLEITLSNGGEKAPSWKQYGILLIPKAQRRFFPGYDEEFIFETDQGKLRAHVTSAPKGTQYGDQDAGSYITGVKRWYNQTGVKPGDTLLITPVEAGKVYKLEIKKK